MRALLLSISADPQMKQSKDTILLAEDKYPENLDALFNKLTLPTSLQNTMTYFSGIETRVMQHMMLL